MHVIYIAFAALAGFSILVMATELACLLAHLRSRIPAPAVTPGISVLKPLCGRDEELKENLESILQQDYPDFEVLFGVRDVWDPAYALAREVAARSKGRARVVVQRGEPGLNPKVNQLITLSAEAKNEIIVISDSNVRVPSDYLSDVASLISQPGVGLTTNLVVGIGEENVGSTLENLHLTGHVAPNICGARIGAGHELVIGKSMAMRKTDIARLGGFESVKDVLAEDWVLGERFRQAGHHVALSPKPVYNISRRSTFRQFVQRYARWALIQRQGVSDLVYLAEVPLFPIAVSLAFLAAFPDALSLALFLTALVVRCAGDQLAARHLRAPGFKVWQILLVPFRELVMFGVFVSAFFRSTVVWRGHRLKVAKGTLLIPTASPAAAIDHRAAA
jgi:ceramide glucosyltransferase